MQNVQESERKGISVKTAANQISMSEAYVRRLVDKKILDHFKFGKSVRIVEESWEKYLNKSTRK